MKYGKIFVSVLLLAAFVLFVFPLEGFYGEETREQEREIVVIGSDAADWQVLSKLVEEGKLPHFKKMMEEGSYGNLSSPTGWSPVEWTSIASGVRKEKHGIGTSWTKNGRLINSSDVKVPRIWNILSKEGRRVGIYNWLLTWPVEEVNGIMISGPLSQGSPQVYPSKLKETLKVKNLSYTEKFSPETASFLVNNYSFDLYMFYEKGIYSNQEVYWDSWVPKKFSLTDKEKIKKGRERIERAWKKIDKLIGQLGLKNKTIFFVSDHGMKAVDPTLYINFNSFFERGNIGSLVEISKNFRRGEKLSMNLAPKGNTSVDSLVNSLKGVRYGNGTRFFKDISVKEESAFPVSVSLRMDFPEKNKGKIPLNVSGKKVDLTYSVFTGGHPPGTEGVIVAKGPYIKEDQRILGASTEDVAPTILYLGGLKIPNYMDGEVAKGLVKPQYLKENKVKNYKGQIERETLKERKNDTALDKVRESLRKLGYVL